jgi:hypothetical protein
MILVSKTKGLRPLDPHQGSALDPPGQVPWTPIIKEKGLGMAAAPGGVTSAWAAAIPNPSL